MNYSLRGDRITAVIIMNVIFIVLKCAGALAGFLVVTAAGYMPFVLVTASKKYEDDCDILLMLGGDIIGADTPAPQTFERMKKGAEYLKAHPDTIAIPCGGCFRKEQKKSEAQIFADYLISQGIERDRIILEDKSTTTFENFDFASMIIKERFGNEEKKVAFLTSSYHIFRASLIAKICGVKISGKVTAPTPGEAFRRYVREYFVAYQLPVEAIKRKAGKK